LFWFAIAIVTSQVRSLVDATDAVIRGGKIQVMLGHATVEEIIPLVEALSPLERARLLRLITMARSGDSSVYEAIPPSPEEFSSDDDPLAWDSEGWENVA
jgi:hypothetical protein